MTASIATVTSLLDAHHARTRRAPEGGATVAEVAERLQAEFGTRIPTATIVRTVRGCRRELDIVSGPPLPELLERLARQRLADRLPGSGERAERRQTPARRAARARAHDQLVVAGARLARVDRVSAG